MNIKSLLLGSAAALVAVSGARAADAVMAEPEAVEYVRVCDAYGAGFFYIPGTETCLKIGGRVEYKISFADDDDGWKKRATAMLNFDARSDTELGTLRAYIEFEMSRRPVYNTTSVADLVTGVVTTTNLNTFNWGTTLGLNHAYISLGGLKMGWSDTLWDGDINGEFDSFGGAGVNFIGYTFSGGNGFSFTLNLEEADFNFDYTPNVVAKASYDQGMFGLNAWAAYDATAEEFGLKAIVTAKLSDPFTLQLGATYNSDQNFYSNGYDWSLAASGKFQVNEKLSFVAGGQYLADQHVSGNDDFALGIVAEYVAVPNFVTTLAVNYKDGDSYSDGAVDGFLRFRRNF